MNNTLHTSSMHKSPDYVQLNNIIHMQSCISYEASRSERGQALLQRGRDEQDNVAQYCFGSTYP